MEKYKFAKYPNNLSISWHKIVKFTNKRKRMNDTMGAMLRYNPNDDLHSNRIYCILFDIQVEDHRVVSVPYNSVQVCIFEKSVQQRIVNTCLSECRLKKKIVLQVTSDIVFS